MTVTENKDGTFTLTLTAADAAVLAVEASGPPNVTKAAVLTDALNGYLARIVSRVKDDTEARLKKRAAASPARLAKIEQAEATLEKLLNEPDEKK